MDGDRGETQGSGSGGADQSTLQLQGIGVTLLSIVLSVGVTVAFGISGGWWLRVLVGAGTVAGLILLIGFGARPGRGGISRLARWITHTRP